MMRIPVNLFNARSPNSWVLRGRPLFAAWVLLFTRYIAFSNGEHEKYFSSFVGSSAFEKYLYMHVEICPSPHMEFFTDVPNLENGLRLLQAYRGCCGRQYAREKFRRRHTRERKIARLQGPANKSSRPRSSISLFKKVFPITSTVIRMLPTNMQRRNCLRFIGLAKMDRWGTCAHASNFVDAKREERFLLDSRRHIKKAFRRGRF